MRPLQTLARRWLTDFDAHTPGRLFEQRFDLTIQEAYELQNEITRLRESRGERVTGYKVGCVSRVIQEQLGVSEPIFGRVYEDECLPNGAALSMARYSDLAIEGEIAVRLARDLSPHSTNDDSEPWFESAFPIIELHNYRLHGGSPPAIELIAGSGMHAGIVRPDDETAAPTPNSAHRLSIEFDGQEIDAVDGLGLAESIRTSLRWLSGKLAEFGLPLRQGQIVLIGSPMRLFPVRPGIRIGVRAIGLGQCRAVVEP